jgi:chemotaxis protein methyltransferase CheR
MSTTLTVPVPIVISEFDFQKFCEYFYRRTGILFSESKRYYVDKRLIERINKSGMKTFEQYFSVLRRQDSSPEIERLINLFTINETYFYREAHQFACLVQNLLPERTADLPRGARLRIWSMPCSTGEEPYSIALYLMEHWPQVNDFEVELIGSDIDTAALAAAQTGFYDARALQKLPREVVQRYFTAHGENLFQLSEGVRQCVHFTQVNASDARAMRQMGQFDVVFCRNMLIYFDEHARARASDAFYDGLLDGGFICLGHSESMSRISSLFQVRAFPHAIVYQKPGGHR